MAASELPKVLVILGAGANREIEGIIGGKQRQWIPPLADELFGANLRQPDWWNVIQPYRGAQDIAVRMSYRIQAGGVGFENLLREFAEHSDQTTRQNFLHVPPYLRDLLWAVSYRYTDSPSTLIQLCATLLADVPHNVMFVTLNYDTFLEQALETHDRTTYEFLELDDYVRSRRRAVVVKLHGSVDWATPIGDQNATWDRRVLELPDNLSEISKGARVQKNINQRINEFGLDNKRWYPVLTAPLAGKDVAATVCPRNHIEALQEFIAKCEKILIIGNSGNDDDLLTLLDQKMESLRLVVAVGQNQNAAIEIIKNYEAGVKAIYELAQPMGDFVFPYSGNGIGGFIGTKDFLEFAQN